MERIKAGMIFTKTYNWLDRDIDKKFYLALKDQETDDSGEWVFCVDMNTGEKCDRMVPAPQSIVTLEIIG